MIRRLRSAAKVLLQGTHGVAIEVLALAALFGFAALIAFLVTLIA